MIVRLVCVCVQEPCLLPEVTAQDQGKICVVIDLDETLVHSSFKVMQYYSEVHWSLLCVCVSEFILVECLTTTSVLLQPIENADFIVPVEIEGTTHQVRVCAHLCVMCA